MDLGARTSIFIVLIMTSLVPTARAACSESQSESWWDTFDCYKYSAAVGAVAAVGVAVGAPAVLGVVGFTKAGIAAGSMAAKMMATGAAANGGGVAAGGIVATFQSVGATGVGSTAVAAVGVVAAQFTKYVQGDCHKTPDDDDE